MKNISLSQWIYDGNMEKWQTICRMNDKKFTIDEVNNLLDEMKELAYYNREFNAIFMVIISQYYYDLFPKAPKDKFK